MSGRQAFHPFQLARRGNAALRVLVVVFVLLAIQFFRLQILEYDQYQLRSESNRLRPVPLTAPRGLILDRRGEIIAENVPGYSVFLVAERRDSLRMMLDSIQQLVPLDPEQVSRALTRHRAAPYEPVLIIKDAPLDIVARLEERRSVLPGLVIQTEPKRFYPDSSAVAHLVGYVGEITEQELASPAFAGRRPGSLVGKVGLERQYESSLTGRDGVRFVEVDALRRVVREEGAPSLGAEQGEVLRTTIDMDLQRFVAAIFPKQFRGAIIAMEPATGAILAMYSNPSYDPNAFVGGIERALWRQLSADPAVPLLNRAISARYPPASVFKLATVIMGLESGVVDLDDHMPVPCRGGMQFGTRFFRCWKADGHGSLDLIGAVASSCDVYFYQLGMRLGVPALARLGVALGFRDTTGVDLPGEIGNVYPTGTAYYDRLYGRGRWTNAVALNLSIGQGENAQTLVSMVRFYAALANGGYVPTPHVVRPRVAPPEPMHLSDTTLMAIRRSLIAVVERGTARGARLAELRLAGKTGTAQNSHGLDHGLFVGFAPAERPAIVVGGILEFGEHGSTVAPYVARVIERYLLGPDSVRGTEPMPYAIPRDSSPRDLPLDSPPAARNPGRGATPRPAARGAAPR